VIAGYLNRTDDSAEAIGEGGFHTVSEALPRNAKGRFPKRELRDTLDPADAT
jgi:hypothetical protein